MSTLLPTLRERLEQRERDILAPYAAKASETRGRLVAEMEHEYRTAFQRDRDRILHSKAFRRLKRKTQVFLAAEGDHYRTRLTHTLEVAQIARSVARALFLNEDLTEAIALGHDLGHAPFGHAGESVLNEVFADGFNHAEQSLRMVDKLETRGEKHGLNLTFEVRDGILNHSKGKVLLLGRKARTAATLEGGIVAISDAIAYINHDIQDAIRAGVLRLEDLPRDAIALLGTRSSQRINAMVVSLIEGSREGELGMTPEVRDATQELRAYMYQNVYPCEPIDVEIQKAKKIIKEIYFYLVENPTTESSAGDHNDSFERRTVDFIAGMTDHYALKLYQDLFFPSAWKR